MCLTIEFAEKLHHCFVIAGIDTCRSRSIRRPTCGVRWLKPRTGKRRGGESTALQGACPCSPSGSEGSSKKLSRRRVCRAMLFMLAPKRLVIVEIAVVCVTMLRINVSIENWDH